MSNIRYRNKLDLDESEQVLNQPSSNIDDKSERKFEKLVPDEASERKFKKIAFIVLSALSLLTRFYNISEGNFVLYIFILNTRWDEAHFGKFGSHYLKRDFYFDVHPPLGKMLVGVAGLLSGYDGSFEFKSGTPYPETLNYVGMRSFLAVFGVLAVPFAYLTATEMRLSQRASIFVGLCVLLGKNRLTLDNGLIGISRLILLDSMLIFFTILTTYFLAAFYNRKSFTKSWWKNLFGLGASIGCVASVKWVGFFVTALVGLHSIQDIWENWGNLKMSIKQNIRHFSARALFLIFLPISIYLLSFFIHFKVLHRSGPGDAQMSSLFQAGLIGNDLHNNPLEVAYGSVVTLKNLGMSGGLLHSHIQTYPEGSMQQQITTYHHKDSNNQWKIIPVKSAASFDYSQEVRFLQDGDELRMLHNSTFRCLHSHPVNAPVTAGDYEVSGYGNEDLEDPNDDWIVEIVEDLTEDSVSVVRSLTTRFRLRHKFLGCHLKVTGNSLPEWGFKQGEVVCAKKASVSDKSTWWNVESHKNDLRKPK